MKKLMALVLSLVMVLSFAVTAMAASVSSPKEKTITLEAAWALRGGEWVQVYDVIVTPLENYDNPDTDSAVLKAAIQRRLTDAESKASDCTEVAAGIYRQYEADEITVSQIFDISKEDQTNVTLRVKLSNFDAENFVCLLQKEEGGEWFENESAEVVDGYLYLNTSEFAAFAIVVKKAPGGKDHREVVVEEDEDTESPVTGRNTPDAFLFAAVLTVSAAALYLKKRK